MVIVPPVVSMIAPPLRTLARVKPAIEKAAPDFNVPPLKLKVEVPADW